MAGIGDIRRAAMGAARTQRQFQRAITGLRNRMVREAQVSGREVFKRMHTRYAQGFYADKAGRIVPIRPYGPKWAKRKAELGLDMRPGVARRGILKTVRSPLAFIKRPRGFDIDLTRPNLTVTGKATLGKSARNLAGKRIVIGREVVGMAFTRKVTNRRSFRVNAYIGAFAGRKAPGLGNIARRDVAYIVGNVNKAAARHIAQVKGAAQQQLTGKALAKITLRLDRLTA